MALRNQQQKMKTNNTKWPQSLVSLSRNIYVSSMCFVKRSCNILPLLGFSLLIACGSSDDSLEKYMREIKNRPPKPVEPIPEYTPPPSFQYPENIKRRSPFKPIEGLQEEEQQLAPDIDRPKQPLEFYPLDALKFVGILKAGNQIWALIQRPDGVITRVRSGDYLGQNYGQIKKITEDTIKLEETVKVNGKWEKKPITLKLRSPSP